LLKICDKDPKGGDRRVQPCGRIWFSDGFLEPIQGVFEDKSRLLQGLQDALVIAIDLDFQCLDGQI